jgi:hypothetical protein
MDWKKLFGGSVMTQVAICRFLVDEGIIDRARLVAYVDKKRKLWEKAAGPEGGVAAQILLTGVASEKEPEYPKTLH